MAKIGCSCGNIVRLEDNDYWYVIPRKTVGDLLAAFKQEPPFEDVYKLDRFLDSYMDVTGIRRKVEYCPYCGRIITDDLNDPYKVTLYLKTKEECLLANDKLVCCCGITLAPEGIATHNYMHIYRNDYMKIYSLLMGKITMNELLVLWEEKASNALLCPTCEMLWLNNRNKNKYEGWIHEKRK